MNRFISGILLVAFLFPLAPVAADETVGSDVVSESTLSDASTTPRATLFENASSTEQTIDASSTEQTSEASTSPVDVAATTATTTDIAAPSQEILVSFKDSVDLDTHSGSVTAANVADSANGVVSDSIPSANAVVVSVPEGNAEAAADVLEANPAVAYAEPNYSRNEFAVPTNDTYRDRLWGIENTGQSVNGTSGTAGDDIDGIAAWNLSLGTSTIVAVIDSGVMYTHPDLAGSMWDGTNCVSDTGSPLGGCLHGYDFADNDLDPMPVTASSSYYHGTHVAGTIAATKNNNAGIVGVAPSAKIMAIRFGFDVASEVRAIDFARENGATVINASFGGTQYSQLEYDAIKRFTDAGGIFVAAAGNNSDDSDTDPIYPAANDIPNIISVAATDQNDALASFSNYGTTTVDLGAPGVNIASTYEDASSTPVYAYLNGTSMAAPHVAGVVALIKSLYPALSATSTKEAVLSGGDADSALASTTVSGKRLNAYGALEYAGADHVPSVITLNGAATLSLTVGDVYTELGATATDNVDASTTVIIGGDTVDTANAGTYTVTYNATDLAGNHAVQITRVVTVTAPVVISSGGGGGGGGGSRSSSSSSSKKKSGSTQKTTPVVAVAPITSVPGANPARPALTSTAPTAPAGITAPIYVFTTVLGVGSTGPAVVALQNYLTLKGVYTGPITGYFGPLTRAALATYQVRHALPPVGITGPMTRALLNSGA